jgi:uncharacterized caspase-like protein
MKKFTVVLIFFLAIASVTAQEQKGDLWVLAVGINEYSADSQYYPNLNYCVSDAQNIRDVFKAQEGRAFNTVHTLLVADTETVKPTRSNILSNLSFLRNARANDTVIVYFALHSVMQDGAYYLLLSDFRHETGERLAPDSMINFNDIVNSFTGQGTKIIMLDTHYSETAIKAVSGKNIAVLGACKDNEQAQESALYRGGIFTTSIVEAFNGGASPNGRITLGSLSAFITDRVRRISQNRQSPVLHIPAGMADPVLGLVERASIR